MFERIVLEFIARHTRQGVLLDSNLLLPLVAADLGPQEFARFKRMEFTFEDALLLRAVASRFRTVLTTPALLAETSNLGGYAPMLTAVAFRRLLANWIESATERWEPSPTVTQRSTYDRHGFTDATVALLVESENVVAMTADIHLFLELESLGLPCLNFRHIQAAMLLGRTK